MSETVTAASVAGSPMMLLHLEPDSPLEVAELTGSLAALARRYASFVESDKLLGKASDARLLVWSVAPGSIDVTLLPDIPSAAGLLASIYDPLKFVTDFAKSVKDFLELFHKTEKTVSGDASPLISVKDCEDAISIAAPITNRGGSQTVYVVHGDFHQPIITVPVSVAREITTTATARKTLMQQNNLDVRERVPMIWSRLDRDKAKSDGQTPDKGRIEEIDPKPRPILFTSAMTFLKDQMISDEDNPYQHIYFVDVEVSRVQDKVVSYRIVGYHGKDEID